MPCNIREASTFERNLSIKVKLGYIMYIYVHDIYIFGESNKNIYEILRFIYRTKSRSNTECTFSTVSTFFSYRMHVDNIIQYCMYIL